MDATTLPSQQRPLAPPQQRHDERCSEIVDKGIAVQNCFSTLCAIEYLKSNNVGPDVIERVLLHPNLRRKVPQ
ncbi:hypothetical protein [Pseudoduganella namucuonensis]|uniref:Uncharacterized protein n=1 Tax=Pseudoduganella namucuonensis TaxID=1035707 RepID=A0A1I7GPH7_9BURK|nr:hypothetical protein [Pseudoduganella namucuonensis]SFU50309.1 hypothetical protein SAMN05216552_100411 [Pseudoduganella namucuonensis]